jgi:hypothetical protein
LYQQGLQEIGITVDEWEEPALGPELARAKGREIADDLVASGEAAKVLAALVASGIPPVVLKGRTFAERFWPSPWMRPAGDLDVLVGEREFGRAVSVLAGLEYQVAGVYEIENGRWRQEFSEAQFGRRSVGRQVDLHAGLHRTVGAGIATRDVLRRAVPASLLGIPIRVLDPGDEILYLMIHAAKHGLIHAKWMLDLHAARLAPQGEAWTAAVERALAARAIRPFWAVARLLHPSPPVPIELGRRLRPSFLPRTMIPHFVRLSRTDRYAAGGRWSRRVREWLLEDRLTVRFHRLLGDFRRIAVAIQVATCGYRASRGELRNQRWLDGALSGGRTSPVWVRLVGTSMAPSLRPGDLLLVAPLGPGQPLKAGDVYLARRAGRLVAHRLIRSVADTAVTRGDGLATDDPPISLRDVLGRVIAVRSTSADASD